MSRYRRDITLWESLLIFMGALVLVGLAWFFSSWMIMLAVGNAHILWWHKLPLMSYFSALMVDLPFFLAGIMAGVGKGLNKKN